MAPSKFQKRAAAEKREQGETITQYFSAERASRPVLRFELQAILTQFHKAQQQNTVGSRIWRYLKAKMGSGPVHAVEPPKDTGA